MRHPAENYNSGYDGGYGKVIERGNEDVNERLYYDPCLLLLLTNEMSEITDKAYFYN